MYTLIMSIVPHENILINIQQQKLSPFVIPPNPDVILLVIYQRVKKMNIPYLLKFKSQSHKDALY